jgi:hypothetical protein
LGEQELGFLGEAVHAGAFPSAQDLQAHTQSVLGRHVTLVPGRGGPIQRIAWCSGGAQGYFEAAIAAGADAFLTGEISEPQAHYARECGVAFWHAVTTPANAMARPPLQPTWRQAWGCAPIHRHRQPGMKPIAITQGDAAGIGPELIAKIFLGTPDTLKNCVVVGDAAVMQRALQVFSERRAGSGGACEPRGAD